MAIHQGSERGLIAAAKPIEQMGREMTRLVLSLSTMQDRTPRRVTLDAELAIRGSTVGAN